MRNVMRIVKKVWGEEQIIVNTPQYCGKRMILNKGMQSSLHYHKIKRETFWVESGLISFTLSENTMLLRPGDIIHIPPGVHHRFGGLEESVFFEFSTHDDEHDSYRLTHSGPMV